MNILNSQFVNTNQDPDSIVFWNSIQHRVPALADIAKACIGSVLNSALRTQSEATVFTTLYMYLTKGYSSYHKLLSNWF